MALLERFFKNSLQGAFLQEIFNFFLSADFDVNNLS